MSKQKINESVVRRMMKIANIDSYADKFIKENYAEIEEEKAQVNEEMEEAPVGEPGPEEVPSDLPMDTEPEGPVSEPMIADLVKAIADAITDKTGVPVEVEGGEGEAEEGEMDSSEEMEMEPEEASEEPVMETGSKRTPESTPGDRKPDMARETAQVEEDKEVVAEEVKPLKKTMPNESGQGKVKSSPRPNVDGTEKPTKTEGKDHKMVTLEEKLVQRVLERILSEFKKKS